MSRHIRKILENLINKKMITPYMMKIIRIVLLVLIVIGIGLLLTQKTWLPKVTNYLLGEELAQYDTKTGSRWTGKINSVKNDCIFDGMCTITVSGVEVVVVQGMVALQEGEEMGQLRGVESVGDMEKYIGQEANVFARKISSNLFTLYGNKDFFIELKK
jgi:hypothetical protein